MHYSVVIMGRSGCTTLVDSGQVGRRLMGCNKAFFDIATFCLPPKITGATFIPRSCTLDCSRVYMHIYLRTFQLVNL